MRLASSSDEASSLSILFSQSRIISFAGNLNPAVSVGLLAGGRLPLVNAILYIVVQVSVTMMLM